MNLLITFESVHSAQAFVQGDGAVRHARIRPPPFERSGLHSGTVHCDRAADALVSAGLSDGRKRMFQEEWPDFAQDCAADAVIQETRTKRHPWRSFHAEAIE